MVVEEPHDKRVDIWSLGILCFEFCCGFPPFEAHNNDETYKRIKNIDLKFPDHLSPEVRHLIQNILTFNPEKRYTLEQIENHPIFLQFAMTLLASWIFKQDVFQESKSSSLAFLFLAAKLFRRAVFTRLWECSIY